ncbi:MAG: hypothetical protein IBX61_00965 [Thermoleophilia bacterium]|nr:hypothetical protein [Thermoleophilia bacterium]
MTPVPHPVGDIPAGDTADATLVFQVPQGTASFRTANTASAEDTCGNLYQYP